MRLKYLELQGFKTFPNKTRVEFVDGISAVVGPNGSGKSNVSDAMRWVLGEQSIKNLRCSKLEDVIFAGSASRKPLGFASVKLTFDNHNGDIEGFDDEICIMRRYYRSGESEYFINMKPARLKDINELFMDTGVGKDGYSIIGQGKIDAIISAKSKERREIFEEAAGISGCRYRKEDAENRLKEANENLIRINDIMQELESRVEPLEKQAEKAKLYLKYSERKKDIEISLWVNDIDSFKDKINEHNKKMNIINVQKEELDAVLKELEKEIENTVHDGNACIAKTDELRRNISDIDEETLEIKSKIIVIENNISHNEENTIKFSTEINDNKESLIKIQNDISEKVSLRENKKSLINEEKIELNKSIQELEKLRERFLNYENTGLSIEEKIKFLENEKHGKEVKKLLAQSSINECESRSKNIKPLICSKKDELKKIDENIASTKREKNDIEQTLNDLRDTTNSLESDILNQNKEFERLKKESHNMTLNADSELRKIRLLEELERNMEGFSHSVKSVIKESKSGRLKGIVGIVADIISVPPEYAVAIDIALGASMQNIITESEDAAKKGIYFLKNGKLGRATFLPLTSIKGIRAEIGNVGNGFKGIASDICKYDNRYKDIVNHLLGRVIIADNIDNAVIISNKLYHKFKVVTVDGQVVNAGGSLTGGSVSGKTGLISRASEINRLKQSYKEINEKAVNLRKQFEDINKSIERKKEALDAGNMHINELKLKDNTLFSRLERLSIEKNNYETSIKELLNENECLEEKRLSLSDEIEKYNEQISVAEQKLISMNSQLDDAKETNNRFNKESEIINTNIQQFKVNLMTIENEIDVLNIEISNLEVQKEDKLKRINKLNLDISELKESSKVSREELEKLNINIEKLKEQKTNLCIQIDTLKVSREENERLSVELRKREKEKSKEKEIIIKELSRLEERGLSIQKEYDNTIAKLWDEYGTTLGEARENAKIISDVNAVRKELNSLKVKIKGLGAVNVSAIDEYKEVNNRYLSMKEQVDDIKKAQKELSNIINSLNKDMKTMFLEKFNEINKNFGNIVNELFGGGGGKLILEDMENVLSCGIDISVRIPGKNEIHLEALSGGEKALVAISLYFAIIKVNPPPFCVLDEIEAALDDVNVDRFAAYLRKVCDKTQFIVITHRRGTMEEADALYGVTMAEEGVSKLLELKINELIKA